jgi:hypothetical protein
MAKLSQRNRTIKEATVKRFHYDEHGQRRDVLQISSTRIPTPVD